MHTRAKIVGGGARSCSAHASNAELKRILTPAAMEGEPQETSVEEQLLVACQNGDADTLQRLMTSVLGLDLSLTTEDGATLITNTVIGAGQSGAPSHALPNTSASVHSLIFASACFGPCF